MLLTNSENEKFEKGNQTGDQGQRAKLMKHLLRTITVKISRLPFQCIATHQVYLNQDILNGQGKYIVNNAVRYCASQIALITKLKLKEGSEVTGIRMRVETYKSRFSMAGAKTEIDVPYESGMDPMNGLVDMLKAADIVQQAGAWYSYTDQSTGEMFKFQEKNFTQEMFKKILATHPKLSSEEALVDKYEGETEDAHDEGV